MSVYAVSETTTHNYETLLCDTSSAAPRMNTPRTTVLQNVTSSPPACNVPPSTQMWTVPSVVPEWILAAAKQQKTDPSSPFYTTFLKGEPKALGIVLIVAAIIQIGLAIGLIFTNHHIMLISGTPFWGPVIYIIAGSLTVAAQAKPNICLVKGSLSLNVISSIACIIALIFIGIDFALNQCYYYFNSRDISCHYMICQQQLKLGYSLLSLLLIINLLTFCVSLSVSIFGCRALSDVQSNVPQVFVVQNEHMVSMNPSRVPATSLLPPPRIYKIQ